MRDGQSYQSGPRHKKKFLSNDEPRSTRVKLEKGSDLLEGRPTCITCWKRHYEECQFGIGSFLPLEKIEKV